MMEPIGDRLLVKVRLEDEKTSSGIILATKKSEKAEGEILAIGKGKLVRQLGLEVGEIVVFTKYAGADFEQEKTHLKFLNHDEVIGVKHE